MLSKYVHVGVNLSDDMYHYFTIYLDCYMDRKRASFAFYLGHDHTKIINLEKRQTNHNVKYLHDS